MCRRASNEMAIVKGLISVTRELIHKQGLSKRWDERSGRNTVNTADIIMPIHAQEASRYWGQQFLSSRGFKTSCNEISLLTTGN